MLSLFKALADPTRLRLLHILQQGEFTVQELVEILAMGQSRVSRHLKILLEAGLLAVKREGTWAYYRLQATKPLATRSLALLDEELGRQEHAAGDRLRVAAVLAARRERSRQFFESHARDWDRLANELLPTPEYLPQLLAEVSVCTSLLEIGVGTGGLLAELVRKADAVIGVDNAPAMLAAARARCESEDLGRVELRLGEMEHLPVEVATIDVCVVNMVLHHASAPLAVLQEIFRVLKPGGLLLLADLQRHKDEWLRERLADQWLGFTVEEIRGWGEEAGFALGFERELKNDIGAYGVMLMGLHKGS